MSGILFRMGLAMDVRCVTDSVRLYGATVQLVSVQQAKLNNNYKNNKLKLLKRNAAMWFDKMCKIK